MSNPYAHWFRNAAPYIRAHRGKTFVLAIPGEAVAHASLETLIHDIALLNSIGARIVLVHGARPQIEERLQQKGLESRVHNGHRITDVDTLNEVISAAGSIRARLEALFSMGLINSPMHGLHLRTTCGNFVTAQPMGVIDGTDYGHTGVVRSIDAEAIHDALDDGAIVLVSTLGYSPTGELFNVRLDNLVSQTVDALNADKLIAFCHPVEHLINADARNTALSPKDLAGSVDSHDENSALLTAAAKSCLAGVPRAHILDFQQEGALLTELFTREGCGILVQEKAYETYRTATIEDVGGIIELIRPLEQQDILVTRSRELLEQEITQFMVLEIDGMIAGCSALYPYAQEQMGEVACVAVHEEFRGKGRAGKLLEMVEQKASELQLTRLFTLSTQTSHWFIERGYCEESMDKLPGKKQSVYNLQRNSKIFVKPLTSI